MFKRGWGSLSKSPPTMPGRAGDLEPKGPAPVQAFTSHDKRHLQSAKGGHGSSTYMHPKCRALYLPPGHGSLLGGALRDCRCLRRSLRSLHAVLNRPCHPTLLTSCGCTCVYANSRLKSFSQSSSEEARRLKSLHVHAKRASSFACRKEQSQDRAT